MSHPYPFYNVAIAFCSNFIILYIILFFLHISQASLLALNEMCHTTLVFSSVFQMILFILLCLILIGEYCLGLVIFWSLFQVLGKGFLVKQLMSLPEWERKESWSEDQRFLDLEQFISLMCDGPLSSCNHNAYIYDLSELPQIIAMLNLFRI